MAFPRPLLECVSHHFESKTTLLYTQVEFVFRASSVRLFVLESPESPAQYVVSERQARAMMEEVFRTPDAKQKRFLHTFRDTRKDANGNTTYIKTVYSLPPNQPDVCRVEWLTRLRREKIVGRSSYPFISLTTLVAALSSTILLPSQSEPAEQRAWLLELNGVVSRLMHIDELFANDQQFANMPLYMQQALQYGGTQQSQQQQQQQQAHPPPPVEPHHPVPQAAWTHPQGAHVALPAAFVDHPGQVETVDVVEEAGRTLSITSHSSGEDEDDSGGDDDEDDEDDEDDDFELHESIRRRRRVMTRSEQGSGMDVSRTEGNSLASLPRDVVKVPPRAVTSMDASTSTGSAWSSTSTNTVSHRRSTSSRTRNSAVREARRRYDELTIDGASDGEDSSFDGGAEVAVPSPNPTPPPPRPNSANLERASRTSKANNTSTVTPPQRRESSKRKRQSIEASVTVDGKRVEASPTLKRLENGSFAFEILLSNGKRTLVPLRAVPQSQ